MKTDTKTTSFFARHPKLLPVMVFMVVFGGMGSYFLFTSHADTVLTLYKMSYPGGTKYEIYNTTDAASEKTEVSNGWKLLGSYKFVNEPGSAPIPVYRGHQAGTRNNVYTTSKATIPSGWEITTAFNESSSATVPYGYCRSTASGYKFDLPCGSNPAPPPPAPPPSGGSGGSNPPPEDDSGPGADDTDPADSGSDAAAPSAAADATVTAGTTSASLTIPADDAFNVHITYGISGGPSLSTDDQDVDGDTTINLSALTAKTTYSYQIIRTNMDAVTATSPSASFTTAGFTVALHFTDANHKNVAGVHGSINNAAHSAATSGKDGKLHFTNLASGIYTVSYKLAGHSFTSIFDTSSESTQTDSNGIVTLSDTVNVDKISSAKTGGTTGSSSHVWLIVGIIVLLLLAGAGVWWLLRYLRHKRLLAEYSTLGAQPTIDIIDRQSHHAFAQKQPAPVAAPEHMGESLRDMVIKSMQESAQHHGDGPPPPPPPTVAP